MTRNEMAQEFVFTVVSERTSAQSFAMLVKWGAMAVERFTPEETYGAAICLIEEGRLRLTPSLLVKVA
jgi:hypothetical protein